MEWGAGGGENREEEEGKSNGEEERRGGKWGRGEEEREIGRGEGREMGVNSCWQMDHRPHQEEEETSLCCR
eukprot:98904-Hanusia_phi.AAC.2